MSALTEFQIYAMIRQCESTAAMAEAEKRPRAAAATRARAARYRTELRERIDGLVASGERVPETFVAAEAGRG